MLRSCGREREIKKEKRLLKEKKVKKFEPQQGEAAPLEMSEPRRFWRGSDLPTSRGKLNKKH